MSTQYGFYFDAGRCIGCRSCVVACKDWNDNKTAESVYWRRVTTVESGKCPNVRLSNQSLSCMHCAKPACVAACPSGSIRQNLFEDEQIFEEIDGLLAVEQIQEGPVYA